MIIQDNYMTSKSLGLMWQILKVNTSFSPFKAVFYALTTVSC